MIMDEPEGMGGDLMQASTDYFVTHYNMGHASMVADTYSEDAVAMMPGERTREGRAAVQEGLQAMVDAGVTFTDFSGWSAHELEGGYVVGIGTYGTEGAEGSTGGTSPRCTRRATTACSCTGCSWTPTRTACNSFRSSGGRVRSAGDDPAADLRAAGLRRRRQGVTRAQAGSTPGSMSNRSGPTALKMSVITIAPTRLRTIPAAPSPRSAPGRCRTRPRSAASPPAS